MGINDGTAGALYRVVNNGPPTTKWNLVVLGDGYRASELARFHANVSAFATTLRQTRPFTAMWSAINIYGVDVVSDESGADDPTAPGGPIYRATYFDAKFASPWNGKALDRLLTVNFAWAKGVALSKLKQTCMVLVLVNTTKYGGSGVAKLQVAVASLAPEAYKIAIHEMGHAFGLADEYDSPEDPPPNTEPSEPNITLNATRSNAKWRDLIQASTPVPSGPNPRCQNYRPLRAAVPRGAVGLFEGGGHSLCGVYRPADTCYMRNYDPFCPVCSRVIERTLRTYL